MTRTAKYGMAALVAAACSLSVDAMVKATAPAPEGTPKVDARLKKAMDKSGLKYDVDKDGDVRVGFAFEDGRSQLVFVLSETSTVDSEEVREVVSAVAVLPKRAMTQELALKLLLLSASLDSGRFAIEEDAETGMVLIKLVVVVRASATAETLRQATGYAASIADEAEKALTGLDRL